MKLKRLTLLNELKRVMPGVESGNSILDGADTITFTEDGIYTYNDSMAVSVPVETGLLGSVKSKEFFNLLQKLKGEELSAAVKNSKIIIKCGNTKSDIKIVESSIMPYLENLKLSELKFKKVKKGFMDALKLCKITGSTSPNRGIYVDDDVMMSTDEIRIAYCHLNGHYPRFWIDDIAVNELIKVNVNISEIAVSEGWVHFKEESGSIFSCKTNNADKYKYDILFEIVNTKAIKKKNDPEGELPATFKEVVDRVSVFSEDVQGFEVVQLKLTNKDIILSCSRDVGSIKESIPWGKELDIDCELETCADAGFLMEAFSKSKQFYVTKTENNTFIVFHKEKFTLVLCAIL